MKPIAYFPLCTWQSIFNFTAYLQSLTGFSWDKTGLTLYRLGNFKVFCRLWLKCKIITNICVLVNK